MGQHTNTVFRNSCLRVPVNPTNRLPSAMYERNLPKPFCGTKKLNEVMAKQLENDDRNNILSFREFYKSIPDYKDVNHLSNTEFYLKLETLRENKHKLMQKCDQKKTDTEKYVDCTNKSFTELHSPKKKKTDYNYYMQQKDHNENIHKTRVTPEFHVTNETNSDLESMMSLENIAKNRVKISPNPEYFDENVVKYSNTPAKYSQTGPNKTKRNNSACSKISWNDELHIPPKNYNSTRCSYRDDTNLSLGNSWTMNDDNSKKSYSVPTSPTKKSFKTHSPKGCFTVSQPFKMTERDDENRIMSQLREASKELEYNILQNSTKRKHFKANPVPIESRIPLYDKILEDQELRRSISKLQSTAELQAQMKPFTFTEREERSGGTFQESRRLCRSNPHLADDCVSPKNESPLFKEKRFRAKPVPKNLFSNYIYEKMSEDNYFRALNRRIRAEEMLKASSLPPSMAQREKYQSNSLDSPTACEKYNRSPDVLLDEKRTVKKKNKRRSKNGKHLNQDLLDQEFEDLKHEFVSSGSRVLYPRTKKKRNKDCLRKIYGSHGSETATSSSGSANRCHSTTDICSINRSNLAAVLRIESTKRKMEADVLKRMEEERYQSEVKWRDSILRRKPAWDTLKYSHAGDLEMRVQTRRDEERLRREQFLHEMELMYGRVHSQPLMFERTYSPRRGVRPYSDMKLSEDLVTRHGMPKPRSALSKRVVTPNAVSPNRSRKVSINETAETIGDFEDYLYKNSDDDNDDDDDDDKDSKSSQDIPESIAGESHDGD